MWIVKLALRRPYTFVVMAILMLVLGIVAIASMPTGRFTNPEEVATLVALLASPRTANVTGSNYVIDGGLIKTT